MRYYEYVCEECRKESKQLQTWVDYRIRKGYAAPRFCSKQCGIVFRTKLRKPIKVSCKQCGIEFFKKYSQVVKSPNHFCGHPCAAKYNNTHKTKGTRISKLEVWIQRELSKRYPLMDIHYNQKNTIGSELDIYIPDLRLAFELNGIFHYEPIFGALKLESIKHNDSNKQSMCLSHGIDLCVIDTSSLKYFKLENVQQYLSIICNIIDSRTKK